MNENEFRDLVHDTMTATTPPPPMDPARTVRLGPRALVRRRAAWSAAGVGALVVLLVGATSLARPAPSHPNLAGSPGNSVTPTAPPSADPGTPWPTGPGGTPQEDRTARAGARYDAAVALMNTHLAPIPPGYTVPTADDSAPLPPRYNQAQFAYRVSGVEVWEYEADVEVTRDGHTGQVLALLTTPHNTLPTQPCALAQTFWDMKGTCQVQKVGTAQVGVVIHPTTDHRWTQWAAYRYPNGAALYLAQSLQPTGSHPPLTTLPYTLTQLATLATDPRFNTH